MGGRSYLVRLATATRLRSFLSRLTISKPLSDISCLSQFPSNAKYRLGIPEKGMRKTFDQTSRYRAYFDELDVERRFQPVIRKSPFGRRTLRNSESAFERSPSVRRW